MNKRWLCVSALFAFLLSLHLLVRINIPFTLWEVPSDAPVMSLAEGVNIDYWLSRRGGRPLSEAQVYQPAIPFQLVSWLSYRLTASNLAMSAEDLFRRTIAAPEKFWWIIQALPLFFSLVSLFLISGIAKDAFTFFAVSVVYFSGAAALEYGTISFFNESLSLLFAIIFFPIAVSALRDSGQPSRKTILCGIAGALLYMHKMNYVLWAFALIPAFWMQSWLKLKNEPHMKANIIRRELIRDLQFLGTMIIGVIFLGHVFLGSRGYHWMLRAHKDMFFGSGIHGAGKPTIFSLAVMFESLGQLINNDPTSAMLLLVFILGPVAIFLVKWRDISWRERYATEGVLLWTAISVMSLAVIKHYQYYYLVSITAVFPFMLLWMKSAGVSRRVVMAICALACYGYFQNASRIYRGYQGKQQIVKIQSSDEEAIAKLPEDRGKRLLMYRALIPEFQRLFLVSFSGLPELEKIVDESQGDFDFFSPWSTEFPPNWRYLVAAKTDAIYLDAPRHSILYDPSLTRRTELKGMVLFENLR